MRFTKGIDVEGWKIRRNPVERVAKEEENFYGPPSKGINMVRQKQYKKREYEGRKYSHELKNKTKKILGGKRINLYRLGSNRFVNGRWQRDRKDDNVNRLWN